MYPQALLFDDDDGNIANGTPNGCEINAAFEAHGLLDPTALGEASIEHLQVEGGRQIRLLTNIPVFPGCPVDLDSAELHWRLRETPDEVTTVPMVQDGGAWVATIPAQATGVVAEYQVTMSYSNGLDSQLPDNAADPWYQTFFGAVVPIYCLDDEADLGAWNFSGPGSDWSFGPLDGVLSVDPGEPYDADGVLLSQDGEYSSGSNTTATGPVIDVGGFDDVRLHYRRWLTVEDGFYDQATIYANDVPIWQNLETEIHSVHHTDREWRFHDLPLDDFVVDDTVELAFGLRSDGGLEFGGWTVDALCVVQVVEAVCGDGQITGAEECDDGNLEEGDGCDAECGLEEPPGETGDPETGGLDESGTSGSPDGTTGGSLPPGGTGDEEGTGTGDTEGSGEASDGGGCGCVSGRGRGVGWEPLLLLAPWVRRRRRRRAV
ncbi:MAG: DUF4215 domain-containing protein [Myxococcales bacterium]|nr:DUF4215 domain-containing protein [Myxococcales bacterium]MCB9718406.1 DUF4215 domain-containing protein [Myxococcales bacterium]